MRKIIFQITIFSSLLIACGSFPTLSNQPEPDVDLSELVVTERPTKTPQPTSTPFPTPIPQPSAESFNNYAMDWIDVWQADDALKDYDNGKYDISGGMQGIRFWDWKRLPGVTCQQ